jgi:hypothetical protein
VELDLARHARHITLPEIGPEGQARIAAARVTIVGRDLAAEIAATYLRAAGVEQLSVVDAPPPGEGWLDALSRADIVVRSGFDDDAMGGVAAGLGLPVVIVRARPDAVDLLSFPRRPVSPGAPADTPFVAAAPPDEGPSAVLAGTLAATEALHVIARGDAARAAPDAPIRHLRLPLDGRDPLVQAIGKPQ